MTVEVHREDGVMTAVIDDGRANALDLEIVASLRSAVDASAHENVPLIIAGRSGYFCAGFDLQIMKSGDRELVSSLARDGSRLFREIFVAPNPVVVACAGHALAAGALLLLAADCRIGQSGPFKLGLNEVRIGIALPQFAVDMARFRLNTRHLISATTMGEVVTPERACEFGYLDRLEMDSYQAAQLLARETTSWDPAVFTTTKKRVNAEIVHRLSEI